jgi:peptide/nickel transport system ATP-binding protein
MTVAASVSEPLLNPDHALSRQERRNRAADLVTAVGLGESDLDRFPHEFSGGQRQRIGIARALSVRPDLIVADEPVSALDVSIQAQILNLMKDLQDRLGMAYLFISHDIGVVERFCDRVAVMYAGHLVEIAAADGFHRHCRHPYTRALVSAIPRPKPQANFSTVPVEGEPPDPAAPSVGCAYHPRCPHAMQRCTTDRPPLIAVDGSHRLACWLNGGQGTTGGS